MTQTNDKPMTAADRDKLATQNKRAYRETISNARAEATIELEDLRGNSRKPFDDAKAALDAANATERIALGKVRALQGNPAQFDRSGDGPHVPLRGPGVDPLEFDKAVQEHKAAEYAVRRASSAHGAAWTAFREGRNVSKTAAEARADIEAARDAAHADFLDKIAEAAAAAQRLQVLSGAIGEGIDFVLGGGTNVLQPLTDIVPKVEDALVTAYARRSRIESEMGK
ncbi:hypothetical protein [Curtobacterium sp. MCLR17_054]|uniref:hypothetical protein n=1 Tax=Curtobacterium sp. MCLR17_054 TaxID=2175632 RepID=UPI0011B60FED|nr:hypothetical protein [Curtobacterium sp. MCLR17_054]WIE67091.1 hypothetical protein DEJ08_011185 [Curtobacterium sp. MCLR17_054]